MNENPGSATESPDLSDLEAFAKARIAAERYPDDLHTCRVAACETCGVTSFELTIEQDEGSKPGRFKGVIWTQCSGCAASQRFLSFTAHPERGRVVRVEHPTCQCGAKTFFVLECERIEVWDGTPSFFDEGIVAGKCAECGAFHTFALTD